MALQKEATNLKAPLIPHILNLVKNYTQASLTRERLALIFFPQTSPPTPWLFPKRN